MYVCMYGCGWRKGELLSLLLLLLLSWIITCSGHYYYYIIYIKYNMCSDTIVAHSVCPGHLIIYYNMNIILVYNIIMQNIV